MTSAPSAKSPRRTAVLIVTSAAVVLVIAGVIQLVGPDALIEPGSWRTEATLGVAALTIALLAADVVLPVPSSIVLVANGALFGAVGGAAVSSAGLLAGAMVGYLLGRRGAAITRRILGEAEHGRLSTTFTRHGPWLVAATRPIPVAAEVATLTAGTARMAPVPFVLAAALGSLAFSVPLALVGAGLVPLGTDVLVIGAIAISGVGFWVAGRRHARPARRGDG